MLVVGSPKIQCFKTGTVEYLASGKLYSYIAGTDTPKATYPTTTDAAAGTNQNTNPIILDSRGEANVVLSGATKLVLKDEDDNLIWTVDNLDTASADIIDANGNELLKFVSTASAVNEFTITNAAAGGPVKLDATGSEADVRAKIASKGTGNLELDAGTSGEVKINTQSSGAITLGRATSISGALTVTGALSIGGNLTVPGSSTLTGSITTAGNITQSTATSTFSFLPPGLVSWYAGATAPAGWVECDGSAVSRTTYAALFAAIGTTYGVGDGSTTFNLPSQARRVLVGKGGSGTATLGNAIGNTGGSETHTLITAELPSHTHTVANVAYTGYYANTILAGSSAQAGTVDSANSTVTTSSTGSGSAHNNMQPSLVMMMIMRAY